MQINQHKYFSYLVNLCISILEFKSMENLYTTKEEKTIYVFLY